MWVIVYDHFGNNRANEWTAIVGKNCIFSAPVNIHTPLQVTLVSTYPVFHLQFAIHLLAVPVHPAGPATVIFQLSKPFVVLWQFQHSGFWELFLTDESGRIVSDICPSTSANMHLFLGSST
jgi:hypothetical protein